jgi:hypothetical protein
MNTTFTISDISNEIMREYIYPDGSTILLNEPKQLYLKIDSGHRVICKDDSVYYIRNGWLAIKWKVHDKSKLVEF